MSTITNYTDPGGCWVAFWRDGSGEPVVFAGEVQALRYALERRVEVRWQDWGAEP